MARKSSIPLDITLEGFRVSLRMPRKNDWKDWKEVRARNKDSLVHFEPEWPPHCLTKNFFRRRLKRQIRLWKEDGGYSFLIHHNESGDLIGGVNINNVCRGAAYYASLGYWLDTNHRGQGLMTEALRLIIGFSFGPLKLHRLNASCIPENTKSHAVLNRLGFAQEGFAEKYLKINGKWRDHILFGLPREAWQQGERQEKRGT